MRRQLLILHLSFLLPSVLIWKQLQRHIIPLVHNCTGGRRKQTQSQTTVKIHPSLCDILSFGSVPWSGRRTAAGNDALLMAVSPRRCYDAPLRTRLHLLPGSCCQYSGDTSRGTRAAAAFILHFKISIQKTKNKTKEEETFPSLFIWCDYIQILFL